MRTLSVGDKVAIIAPASQFRTADKMLLDQSVTLLRDWGLIPEVHVEQGHHFYLAGNDSSRYDHLSQALEDPSISAIFCTRGGYGSARLWKNTNKGLSTGHKLLVGFSDVTTLHTFAMTNWLDVSLIHGPNISTKQLLDETEKAEKNRIALHNLLFDPDHCVKEGIQFLRGRSTDGLLTGGCLSVICTSMGTPFELKTAGKIVFLEDVGEAPYKIDRMLTHLRNAGKFEDVVGIVFGKMKGCEDPYNDLGEVILDALVGYDFPIATGLPSGHGPENIAIRLGVPTTLDYAENVFIQ